MVFSSTVFLFIFLPLVLLGNFLLKYRYRNFFLLVASLIFYAWGEGILVLLMLASIAINYSSGLGISIFLNRQKVLAKTLLAFGISCNLTLLFYYKYANFIVETVQEIGLFLNYNHNSILLPIGISFFTFQGISYLVDVYRRETPVQYNLFHLGLYISLFPQLIAGPIVRYHDIAKEIKDRSITTILFREGIMRFIRGLAKKVIIANNAGVIADHVFSIDVNAISTLSAWLAILCYTIQIYFDFSGYSDMAIGLGKMLGFNFKENFNYPYIAKSIQEFWRRWHISLSTWFRDYLYIPLGGNRKGLKRTYFNLFIVFLLTGLWHGASWNFVFWGLFHGAFLILERAKWLKTGNWSGFMQHGYVLLVVVTGWVFFRVETISDAFIYLRTMVRINAGEDSTVLVFLNAYTILLLCLAVLFSMPIRKSFNGMAQSIAKPRMQGTYSMAIHIGYLTLFVASVVELAQSSYNPFIYFRF